MGDRRRSRGFGSRSRARRPRLRTLARNVYEMYQRIDEFPPPFAVADGDVTILHVSDFHNHPAAAAYRPGARGGL